MLIQEWDLRLQQFIVEMGKVWPSDKWEAVTRDGVGFCNATRIDLDTVQRGSVSGKEESDNYIHYLDTVQRARDDMSYDIER